MAAIDLLRIFIDDLKVSGTPVDVIPVVSDDMVKDRPLLKEICIGLDGQLIDLAELGRDGASGDLSTNPRAEAFVRETVKDIVRPGDDFVLTEKDGRVTAGFSGSPLQNLSAQTVAGAALLPFDNRVLASEVAAVTWSDKTLDVERQRAVWRLLTGLNGEPLGNLQRLFLFVDGPIDFDVHLAGEAAARHCISGGRLHHFKRPSSMQPWTRMLADRHRAQQPIVYILGAGFSCTSGTDKLRRIPLGDTLRDHALEVMFGEEGTDDDRAAQLYRFVADNDLWTSTERVGSLPSMEVFTQRLTLERVLLVQFTVNSGRSGNRTLQLVRDRDALVTMDPSPGVRRFHDLLRAGHPAVIVTVNFDQLVECGEGFAVTKLATPAELSTAGDVVRKYLESSAVPGTKDRPVPYLKLHGTIEDFDTIVADVGSVAGGFDASVEDALNQLADESDPVPWVYVGHSLRDLDLDTVLQQKRFALGTNELWVDPMLAEPVARFAARHRDLKWTVNGRPLFEPRHVTATADRFLAALWNCWSDSTEPSS